MRRVPVLALASFAWLLYDSPITAQSSSGFELARTSATSVHFYEASEAIPRQLAAPPNLVVSNTYRPVVESMLRGSPTFRRQCVRIAAEPTLIVHLVVTQAPRRSDLRAQTRLTRNANGHLSAVVELSPLRDLEELIAHELEHVIEQLDGVDLETRAARPNTGVTTINAARTMFETTRANYTGRKVVAELGR